MESDNLAQLVDPFIGVDPRGNCLCGPYLPLSLVRLSPDTLYPQPPGGYESGKPIVRFSHTHVSGTGGGGRYGNIGVTPFIGPLRLALDGQERRHEQAAAGYYAVTLRPSGIRAELTATPRVGLHRYTFPADAEANILLDIGAVIQTALEEPGEYTGASIGGYVEWISAAEVVGRADLRGGWGHAYPYAVYFYARFDRPAVQRWVARSDGFVPPVVHSGDRAGAIPPLTADGPQCKAVASFGRAAVVRLDVGISYVSIAKARASVAREVGDRDFDAVRARAGDSWGQALARIRAAGGSEEQRALFYTLFTRLLCMPSDLGTDDENPWWQSGVRQFTDFYALWDSVRNANALITLFDPDLEAAFLNALLDIADHTGWLPDAWIAGHGAMVQGGSSADILFCEAALKGLTGIDYDKALRYMRKNGEIDSPDPWHYGRYLRDYRDLGYVSTDVPRASVSRHLEYAYQDWCIGTLAGLLGYEEVARAYIERSRTVWNLWREDIGFFAPRRPDGSWAEPFDPARHAPWRHLDPYFYEGTSWQWSFSVQHDIAGLIGRHGGDDAFVRHLDAFFDGGRYHSKETMLHVPYLYIYAGRPDKTAERVRQYMALFRAGRDGLPDNEDMGAQSAWYMCSAMGLYPLMGQDLYLLSTPVFTRTAIALGATGKTLVIEAPGAGAQQPYIVGATLDGVPLNRAWIRHAEIARGATLRLDVGSSPGTWGTQPPPPSPLGT